MAVFVILSSWCFILIIENVIEGKTSHGFSEFFKLCTRSGGAVWIGQNMRLPPFLSRTRMCVEIIYVLALEEFRLKICEMVGAFSTRYIPVRLSAAARRGAIMYTATWRASPATMLRIGHFVPR
jgi:hypothetical protein